MWSGRGCQLLLKPPVRYGDGCRIYGCLYGRIYGDSEQPYARYRGRQGFGEEYTCRLVLRTLTFLEGKYTKEAFFARGEAGRKVVPSSDCDKMDADMNPMAKRKLKEQLDSDDEVETSTAKRMRMLTISTSTI
ncbi:hypothetical protein B0H14DRAFT_2605956 [Mycena olivaceomarginata]|nr:hypothetical protein B0H14DRAFT_2605956 [Mycena olivaceomarginata]